MALASFFIINDNSPEDIVIVFSPLTIKVNHAKLVPINKIIIDIIVILIVIIFFLSLSVFILHLCQYLAI